jgi:predicted Holliday junction resolvase-like endonuclease
MVAASLPGLPVRARDCRALSDPIDYLAFEGAAGGAISAVHFIEVKSEKARLSGLQQAIKAAVDRGAVTLKVADHRLCVD